MFLAEAACTLDDVVGGVVTPPVDMACGKLLAETDSPAWLDDIDHIAQSGISMKRVASFESALDGRTASVIVHDERIFPRCVEVRRQIETSADDVSARVAEVPGLTLAQLHTVQNLRIEVFTQGRLIVFQIDRIQPARIRRAFAIESHHGRRG